MITIIAAIGKNNELGINNHLLWNLKEDMKFFKEKTINHKVVMGLNTYNSIKRPLPNRENIVLSNKEVNLPKEVKLYTNINKLTNDLQNIQEEVFIIGGASLYNHYISLADKMYLTLIEDTKPADTYFPKINKEDWNITIIKELEEAVKYKFVLFERRTNE